MRGSARNHARAVAAGLTVVLACSLGAGFVAAFGWRQMSVEEVVRVSDLIVLGKVTAKDPHETTGPHASGTFTRSTFKVEAYYKGEGPDEISVLTHGGVWTRPDGTETYTEVVGAEGVRVGEELVAFLKAGPGGYYFAGWGGNAKKTVTTNTETGERTVELLLRKRRYMSPAMQASFDEVERYDKDPNAPVASELPYGKGVIEVVPVKNLAAKLAEIVRGESMQINP